MPAGTPDDAARIVGRAPARVRVGDHLGAGAGQFAPLAMRHLQVIEVFGGVDLGDRRQTPVGRLGDVVATERFARDWDAANPDAP